MYWSADEIIDTARRGRGFARRQQVSVFTTVSSPMRVTIRPYQARDRLAVREVCGATADRGEPAENFFPDHELIADLMTRYFTDQEPDYSWVAEQNGRVVGYLNGCLDNTRFRRAWVWRIGPGAVLRSVGRGVLFHRAAWRMLGALLQTGWRRYATRSASLAEYPGQLHVNVRQECRGHAAGRLLVERFEAQARAAGCPGLQASVRGDNAGGCRFFEKLGYRPTARTPLVLPASRGWLKTTTVIYAKSL